MIPDIHLFTLNWDAIADAVSVVCVILAVPFWAFLYSESRKNNPPK